MEGDEYEETIYCDQWIDESLDDDELSSAEAAFMQGYNEPDEEY